MNAQPRRNAILVLGLVVLPTTFFFRRASELEIDVENDAMKSVGTEEMRALERRIAAFGEEHVVLLAFEPLQPAPLTDETARWNGLLDELAAVPGVSSVREWPLERSLQASGTRLLVLELGERSGGFGPVLEEAERVARERARGSFHVAVGGQPAGELVIAREVQAESGRILPWIAGGLFALLLACYRRLELVAAVLLPAGLGIVWTQGLFAWLGHELDPVSVLLPPVLLTVGVASGVHLIEAYLDELARSTDAGAAVRNAVRELWLPATMAATTTVVGFLSLAFNAIPAIVDFGVFAAFGVALTFTLSLVAGPALLVILAPRIAGARLARRGRSSSRAAAKAADLLARRARPIRGAALLVSAAALVGWTRIEVDNDPLRILPEEHPFRRDAGSIARTLGGAEVFDVLVPAGCALAEPTRLALFAAGVLAFPLVGGPAGPALRSAAGDWCLRYLLAPSASTAREELFEAIETEARALGAGEVRATGSAVQIARDSGRLVRGQLWSTGTNLLVFFLLFWVGFRSLHYAVLALVPNFFPCLVVYGGLGLSGRPLSVATAMVGSVLLGLIVDDTIHVLHRFRRARAPGKDALSSLEEAFAGSGRAVLIVTAVLALGFGLAAFGRLSTTVEFGALAATTIVLAFLSDLVLLPVLLVGQRSADPTAEASRA